MASNKTYTISSSFPNEKVDTDRLTLEIGQSSITIALDYIKTYGGDCIVYFKTDLSAGEWTTMDEIVAAHSGESLAEHDKRMSDGKLIVLPDIFNLGTYMNVVGVSDDITNGTRFGGSDLSISCVAQGEATAVDFQLMELVGMVGARGIHINAAFGDWIGLEVFAPAQPSGVITENTGAGDYEKIEVIPSTLYKFKPKVSGDWDLDITSKLNANVNFTKAVVVPSATKTGHFDYDKVNNVITVNEHSLGEYDIYDASIPLGKVGVKVWVIGDDQICMNIPAVRPKDILPHWKIKIRAYDAVYDADKPLKAAINLVVGRANIS